MVEANGNQMRAVEQLPKEHAIIKLSRQSLVNHFVTRNMDIVLAHMADDVGWGRSLARPPPARRPCRTFFAPSTTSAWPWPMNDGAHASGQAHGSFRRATRCSSCRPTASGAFRSSSERPTFGLPRRTGRASCICTSRTPPTRTRFCHRSTRARTPSSSSTSISMPKDRARGKSAFATSAETSTSCTQRAVRHRVRRSAVRRQTRPWRVRRAGGVGGYRRGAAHTRFPAASSKLPRASGTHCQHRGLSGQTRRRLGVSHRRAALSQRQASARCATCAGLGARSLPRPLFLSVAALGRDAAAYLLAIVARRAFLGGSGVLLY